MDVKYRVELLASIRERMGRFLGGLVIYRAVTERIVKLHETRRGKSHDGKKDIRTVNHNDIQKVLETGVLISGSENTKPPGWEAMIEGTTYDGERLRVRVLLENRLPVPVQVVEILL